MTYCWDGARPWAAGGSAVVRHRIFAVQEQRPRAAVKFVEQFVDNTLQAAVSTAFHRSRALMGVGAFLARD